MATRTEGHVFSRPRSRYPWKKWTDGGQWIVVKGEDYHISTYNMQISLHGRAKTQGLKVKSNSFTDRVKDDETGWMQTRQGLIFQFYKENVVDE